MSKVKLNILAMGVAIMSFANFNISFIIMSIPGDFPLLKLEIRLC